MISNLGSHKNSAFENLVALDKLLTTPSPIWNLGINYITLTCLTLISYVCKELNPIAVADIITNNKSHKQRGGGARRKLKEHLIQIPHFASEDTDNWRD